MNKDECIKLLKKYMGILRERYGITSLSLFGSTARDEQTEKLTLICSLKLRRQTPSFLYYFDVDASQILWIIKNEISPLKEAIHFFIKSLNK